LIGTIGGAGDFWWAINASDERLKKDIAPTQADSLAQIMRLRFVGYRFRTDVIELPIDDGQFHPVGLLAQEAEKIEPAWINSLGTFKQPAMYELLMSAMHAIQQLKAQFDAYRVAHP
jgi:hypothetical protein